jgi:hypothetical protein
MRKKIIKEISIVERTRIEIVRSRNDEIRILRCKDELMEKQTVEEISDVEKMRNEIVLLEF